MQTDAVIIGAGPVGLACAIEIQRSGLSCITVDKGALVNSLTGYPTNMEFFSTPDLIEIGGHPLVSSRYKPIREEAIDYYRRVAECENLTLLLFERVTGLDGSEGDFTVRTDKRDIRCKAVVVATGFFDQPNRLGLPGEDLSKVSHYYREAFTYTGRDVCIVGGKNSAAIAALQCHRRGARVTLVHRGPDVSEKVKYWLRPDLVNRIAEGSIMAFFSSTLTAIRADHVELATPEGPRRIPNDVVLALTGYRPDYGLFDVLDIAVGDDPARTPIYNPETHETNRQGVFIAGTVCGGLHTSRWFIENGRHHAALIAGSLGCRYGNPSAVPS
ncbi:MAG: YpdA family putative bacillithiol disulfide reductase [Bacteroidetes bacterium]|nr:YpdA family putative bacillithiol disulfide reductase [Bacteroidota bacterium]MDA0874566.1 YpdA family putative bacillithiol disulfide reductase [Bacteroidota bacterium]